MNDSGSGIVQIGYLKFLRSRKEEEEETRKLLTLLPYPRMKTDKLCAARREFASSASSRRSRLSIIDTLFVDFCPWHSMIFVGGSLYGTFFFFFICSFKIGERMFVIFYSFCGGLKRDWVFW